MSCLPQVLTLMVCEYVVASNALALTARESVSRKICISCLFALAVFEIHYLSFLTGTQVLRAIISFSCIIKLVHLFGLFLVLQVEIQELVPTTTSSYLTRLHASFNCVTSTRGIGTPWEFRIWPHQPEQSRGKFIGQSILALGWQYLAVDLLNFGAVGYCQRNWPHTLVLGAEFLSLQSTKEQLIARIPLSLIVAFNLRLLFAMVYGGIATVSVLLNLSSPRDWPPLFGKMETLKVFSLRGFWGEYWHQLLRWPLKNLSGWIRRQLGLFTSSSRQAQKTADLFLIFALSGSLHVLSAVYADVLESLWALFLFFVTVPFWVKVEDLLIAQSGGKSHSGGPNLLNFLFSMTWLYVCTPWFGYMMLRLPIETNAVMPFSFVEEFGIQAVMGTVALGLLLWSTVGGQTV